MLPRPSDRHGRECKETDRRGETDSIGAVKPSIVDLLEVRSTCTKKGEGTKNADLQTFSAVFRLRVFWMFLQTSIQMTLPEFGAS